MTALLAIASHPKALWYLTRGTGTVALLLLTAAVLLGVASFSRWHHGQVPRFLVSGLHRNATLLAIVFVVVHVVTTVADGFAPIGLKDALLPFLSSYRPVWLGLGAVAFDLLLALVVTSLLRARIGVRAWRAVHWLAYASWPVALVHALGTGSDARTSWLAMLSVACAGAVVLAVVWRAATASAGIPVRAGAVLLAFAVPVGALVWARSGPLRSGWAARAGTPAALHPRVQAARVVGTPANPDATTAAVRGPTEPPLLTGPFDATFKGRIKEAPARNSLVIVRIDLVATGSFEGRVHVALRGVPLDGGGVRMLDSSVGLLPSGASVWYAGHVVALQGQQIVADVRGDGGRPVRFLLAMRIDSMTGKVTGALRGGRPGADGGLGA